MVSADQTKGDGLEIAWNTENGFKYQNWRPGVTWRHQILQRYVVILIFPFQTKKVTIHTFHIFSIRKSRSLINMLFSIGEHIESHHCSLVFGYLIVTIASRFVFIQLQHFGNHNLLLNFVTKRFSNRKHLALRNVVFFANEIKNLSVLTTPPCKTLCETWSKMILENLKVVCSRMFFVRLYLINNSSQVPRKWKMIR